MVDALHRWPCGGGKPAPGLVHIRTRERSTLLPSSSESVSRRSGHHAVDGKDGVFCAGQNALAESFVSTLKAELLASRMKFPSRQAAKTAIFDYLEAFYNTRRLHSALSYRSPADFEEGRMGEANIA